LLKKKEKNTVFRTPYRCEKASHLRKHFKPINPIEKCEKREKCDVCQKYPNEFLTPFIQVFILPSRAWCQKCSTKIVSHC